MPHHSNDMQLMTASSTIMTQAQMDDMKEFVSGLFDKTARVVISDEQFEKLVTLLQPGFELSTMMLHDYKNQRAPEKSPATPEEPTIEQATPPVTAPVVPENGVVIPPAADSVATEPVVPPEDDHIY